MKHNCAWVREAISDLARDGVRLTEEAQRHISECAGCARDLAEASGFSRLVSCVEPVPEAPDCRPRVIDRIALPRRRRWSYAWIGVPTVAVIIGLALLPGQYLDNPHRHTGRHIRAGEAPRNPQVAGMQDSRTNGVRAVTTPPRRVKVLRPPVRVAGRRQRHAPRRFGNYVYVAKSPVSKDGELAVGYGMKRISDADPDGDAVWLGDIQDGVTADVEEHGEPLAVVVVRWDRPSEDRSYAYTLRDRDTGETTTCSVTSSGRTIKVDVRATPDSSESTDGGMIDETNRGI